MLRIAIVHYWIVSEGGGEAVVQTLLDMYPHADLFTLVLDPGVARALFGERAIRTSFLQTLPFAHRLHRHLLPLMPAALESLDLSGYDLVISSESGPAKGVLPPLGATHVCYCHSPMRYIWDQSSEYRRTAGLIAKLAMSAMLPRLRMWDAATSDRVDRFAANSRHVRERIRQYYRRDADVIHPPIDTDRFTIGRGRGGYYLLAGRHVSYKRIDLAIAACERLGRDLVITGEGPETERLKRMARTHVRFVGQCSFDQLRRYYSECRAFLMPGEEDFGIAPVEAMASGRPVIALGKGGALDSVVPGVSGMLFDEPSVEALMEAMLRFEAVADRFKPAAIRAHAERFGRERFKAQFAALVDRALEERTSLPAVG